MKAEYKDNDSVYELVGKNQLNIMDLYTLVGGNTDAIKEALKQLDEKLNAPAKAGTNGQVLMIDANGNVIWGDTGAIIDPNRLYTSGADGKRFLASVDGTASLEHYTDDATGDTAGSGSKYRASNNIIFDVVNERKAGAVLKVDDTAEGTTKRVIVKDLPVKKELTVDEFMNRQFTRDDLAKKMLFVYNLSGQDTSDVTGHIESNNLGVGIFIRPTAYNQVFKQSSTANDGDLIVKRIEFQVTVKTGVSVTYENLTTYIYKNRPDQFRTEVDVVRTDNYRIYLYD